MKRYGWAAAVFSSMLLVSCGDRSSQPRQADEPPPAAAPADQPAAPAQPPAAPAESEPAQSPDPARGGAAARTPSTRGTGGTASRPTTARPATPPAPARGQEGSPTAAEPADTSRPAQTREGAAPARRTPEFLELTIPEGTALPLELETALSSATAQVEAPVRARLRQAVVVNGVTALPAGAVVSGNVTSVERAGRVKGRSSLVFSFTQVRADNVSTQLRTAPLTYVGEGTTGEDATKIGAGAIGGAIVGGIVGGGEGAAKGAAIGGAAGTGVVLATRGKDVQLANGTNLAATLAAPLTIRVPAR